MAASLMMGIGLAASAIGTGIGVYSSIRQSKIQEAQAEYQAQVNEYQAKVAENNQKLAENQASAIRKEGYDEMIAKNQETAKLIGKQRAAAGASGAVTDVGSMLDTNVDTAQQGSIDALNIYTQAFDNAYNKEIEAYNYKEQAANYRMSADATRASADTYGSTGIISALATGTKGIADMSTSYANWDLKKNGNSNALA